MTEEKKDFLITTSGPASGCPEMRFPFSEDEKKFWQTFNENVISSYQKVQEQK